jgi:hypothetical protein
MTAAKAKPNLEQELDALRVELRDAQFQFGQLLQRLNATHDELRWLRRRVASFHPERRHCPKCRALVSQSANKCSACGKRWATEPAPRAGEPM